MSNTNNIIKAYLRPAAEADAPAEARFNFMDVDCVMETHDEGVLHVRKVLKDGKRSAKPIATGRWETDPNASEKQPVFRGSFVTAKDSYFEVAGWYHTDDMFGEEFLSLDIKPRLTRKGFLPGSKAVAA